MKRKPKVQVVPVEAEMREVENAIDYALDLVNNYYGNEEKITREHMGYEVEMEDTKAERLAAFSAILSHLLATSRSNANR